MGRACASGPPAKIGRQERPERHARLLGLVNWQMTQRTAFEMRNKTGSEVHRLRTKNPLCPLVRMHLDAAAMSSRDRV